jgi:hypothetical protein
MAYQSLQFPGLRIGMRVQTPDGRIGILRTVQQPNPGQTGPTHAGVQFLDKTTGRFKLEGYALDELTPPTN